jgi:heme O synthase-like polyprenyltransferase
MTSMCEVYYWIVAIMICTLSTGAFAWYSIFLMMDDDDWMIRVFTFVCTLITLLLCFISIDRWIRAKEKSMIDDHSDLIPTV